MNIDKAIEHAFEVSTTCENANCALEHVQLAFWLKQLKELQSILGYSYDLDRLKELAEADKEGRCVVLPCKHNDTVWFIKFAFSVAHSPIEANYVSIRRIDPDGDILYSCTTVCNKIERRFMSSDIGKTVFLTKAEAEKALEELKNYEN